MSNSSSSDQQQQPVRVAPFSIMPPGTGNGGGSSGGGGGGNPGSNNNMVSSSAVSCLGGGGVQMPGVLSPANALEHYRLTQLYQYAMAAERFRCPPGSFMPGMPPGIRPELAPLFYGPYSRIDPRLAGLLRPPEEPKPQHSYIGLIAMAILSHPDKKLVLSDIYQYIMDNFPYFRSRGPGWRNSIRHNLSLNDCFVKAGRSANGKGHYWAIHPANVDDFTRGDFRRRRAQRKVRKHMGLAVDDDDSPSPPPASPPPVWAHPHHPLNHSSGHVVGGGPLNLAGSPQNPGGGLDIPSTLFSLSAAVNQLGQKQISHHHHHHHTSDTLQSHLQTMNQSLLLNRKRQFDVASLLAPEKDLMNPRLSPLSGKSEDNEREQSLPSPSTPSVTAVGRGGIGGLKEEDSSDANNSEEHSDNEDIEVAEEDSRSKNNEGTLLTVKSEMKSPSSDKERSSNSSSIDHHHHHHHHHSPRKQRRLSLGQDGTSSNEDEGGGGRVSPGVLSNCTFSNQSSRGLSQCQPLTFSSSNSAFQDSFPSSQSHHHLSHGLLSPLDFLQAQQHFLQQQHHHANQQMNNNNNLRAQLSNNNPSSVSGGVPPSPPTQQSFSFTPSTQSLLQQNPNLASLMILSSRYKELTNMSIMVSRRSPQ